MAVKLFECIASRRPIVGSDLPVIREVLTHGDNGSPTIPADCDTIAEGIRAVANGRELRQRIGRAVASSALQYTCEVRASRIIGALMQCGGALSC